MRWAAQNKNLRKIGKEVTLVLLQVILNAYGNSYSFRTSAYSVNDTEKPGPITGKLN